MVCDQGAGLKRGLDEHRRLRALREPDGHEVGGHVRTHVAPDERPADDPSARMHEDPELMRERDDRRCPAFARATRGLGDGAERPLADGTHVETEEEVAHRRVADDHDLVDRPAVDPEVPVDDLQLVVERLAHGLAQLAVIRARVVGDAADDVAPAEPLRVLDRPHVEDGPGLEVAELPRDRRRSPVDRDAAARASGSSRCRPFAA